MNCKINTINKYWNRFDKNCRNCCALRFIPFCLFYVIIHTCTRTHACTHMHTCTHTHAHTCTHTHTRTHAHARARAQHTQNSTHNLGKHNVQSLLHREQVDHSSSEVRKQLLVHEGISIVIQTQVVTLKIKSFY